MKKKTPIFTEEQADEILRQIELTASTNNSQREFFVGSLEGGSICVDSPELGGYDKDKNPRIIKYTDNYVYWFENNKKSIFKQITRKQALGILRFNLLLIGDEFTND